MSCCQGACEDKRIKLPDVTLCCISDVDIHQHIQVLRHCMKGIKFADVIFFTSEFILEWADGFKVKQINPIKDTHDWSIFVMHELHKHFKTSHVLTVQADGYVLKPDRWTEDFLKFDYLGCFCQWPRQPLRNGRFVGPGEGCNGGFALRSHELCQATSQLEACWPEDMMICVDHRDKLNLKDIRFPTQRECSRFASAEYYDEYSFGFHGRQAIPQIPAEFKAWH